MPPSIFSGNYLLSGDTGGYQAPIPWDRSVFGSEFGGRTLGEVCDQKEQCRLCLARPGSDEIACSDQFSTKLGDPQLLYECVSADAMFACAHLFQAEGPELEIRPFCISMSEGGAREHATLKGKSVMNFVTACGPTGAYYFVAEDVGPAHRDLFRSGAEGPAEVIGGDVGTLDDRKLNSIAVSIQDEVYLLYSGPHGKPPTSAFFIVIDSAGNQVHRSALLHSKFGFGNVGGIMVSRDGTAYVGVNYFEHTTELGYDVYSSGGRFMLTSSGEVSQLPCMTTEFGLRVVDN